MRAVNLIPDDQRERSSGFANRSNGAVYIVLGMVAGLALLAFLYGVAKHEVSSKEAEVTRYEAEASRIQAQATRLSPYKTFVAMREGRETAVRELVDTRFDWSHALAEFGRVMPSGTAISLIEGCVAPVSKTGGSSEGCSSSGGGGSSSSSSSSSKGASAVTSATPAGSVPKFVLSGCAKNQSTVARMLSDLRLIDGVQSAELQSAGSGASGGSNCQGSLVSFGVHVTFQPLPTPPSSSSSSSSSSKAVPASNNDSGTTGSPE